MVVALARYVVPSLRLTVLLLLPIRVLLADQPLERLPLVVLEAAVLLQPPLPPKVVAQEARPRDVDVPQPDEQSRPLEPLLEHVREYPLLRRWVVLLPPLTAATLGRVVVSLPVLFLVEQLLPREPLRGLLPVESAAPLWDVHNTIVPTQQLLLRPTELSTHRPTATVQQL